MKDFRGLAPIRRANQQLKSDADAMAAGRLGMSEGEIEQIAGAGQAAAANQAAQEQQAISRASMGQPGFVGEAAKQSAMVTGQAAQTAASSRAKTLAMDQQMKREESAMIKARLEQAKQARTMNIFRGVGLGIQGAGMVGEGLAATAPMVTPAVFGSTAPARAMGPVEPVAAADPTRGQALRQNMQAKRATWQGERAGFAPALPWKKPVSEEDDLDEDDNPI
jgi:hypothetical protein